MYKNLEVELVRHGMTRYKLAQKLGINNGTLSLKLNGKSEISLKMARVIRDILNKDLTLDYLFDTDLALNKNQELA